MRWRKRMLKDLDDDIRDYLERETQDNIDRGMPAEEARFAALRKFGNVVAPEMAEMQLYPMEEELAHALGERSLALRLVSSFCAMALLLAAIGIYAMLAYTVTIRRREIGVRMALGSSRSRVTTLVLRQAGWMVLAGVIPGLAGAWAAGRAVRTFLFGVKPLDPKSLITAIAVLMLTGMVAAALPAWRAALVDPMEALRVDHLAPHDLRRTCAKLCHVNGGELEQIQFLLGHASVLTT